MRANTLCSRDLLSMRASVPRRSPTMATRDLRCWAPCADHGHNNFSSCILHFALCIRACKFWSVTLPPAPARTPDLAAYTQGTRADCLTCGTHAAHAGRLRARLPASAPTSTVKNGGGFDPPPCDPGCAPTGACCRVVAHTGGARRAPTAARWHAGVVSPLEQVGVGGGWCRRNQVLVGVVAGVLRRSPLGARTLPAWHAARPPHWPRCATRRTPG